ncbi:MAG: c-type cytochrome [Actinobacteria bacterium]|nr:c-type cytochrome [Actinomycetota bacterium]
MSTRLEQRRAQHQRYKEDVKEHGKPFFPGAMWHDTVMSLVVVCVIIALASIWYFTSGENPEDAGLLGPRYTEEADAGTTNFIPRPDWYFYFLFYLLRIFKWPDSVILGTVGIPTILLMLMVGLPFFDLRRERRLLRRPVAVVAAILVVLSMGVLTYKGATQEEALGGDATVVADWVDRNNLPASAREGATLFNETGCQQCHVYLGSGSANLGAPDLSDIGSLGGKTEDYFTRYVANPRTFGNNVMPVYGQANGGSLDDQQLGNLAKFLAASKGEG